ncbi:MAG: extracellular solute-binding protein [Candidatus Limiplasma sp.]|nr:extracellular solute-binding protein [Candidatus Limiplasma sp.]
MRSLRKMVATAVALMLLVTGFAAVAETSYDVCLNPAGTADLNMTLTNLDLDGTLTPGMYEGKKIVVATAAGDFENSLKEYSEIFKQLTGGEVEVQAFPDQLFEKTQMALATGGQFDVVIMPIAFIHSFAYAGYLTDLTELLATKASPGYDVEDFLQGLYNTYANYNGMTVAMPFKPDSQVFFYRTDLFEDPAVQAAFKEKVGRDLTVPATPEECLEVAAFFTKSLNPDSPVEYGFSTMMSKGNSRFNWFNRLGYYGGAEVGENFTPGFTNGSGAKALEYMVEMSKYAPADWLTFDWDTANTFFAQGNAAMMEQWPGLYLTCNQADSPTLGKVGFAVVPGSSPTLGGWAMGITADSPELDMAFKFCEMVTSKDGECVKIAYTMDPCRVSNYQRDVVKDVSPMYEALMANFALATQLADTDIPYISAQIGDIEEIAIQAVLSGAMTVEDAIASMAQQMTDVVESVKDELAK